jgi:ribosomal protein S3AE
MTGVKGDGVSHTYMYIFGHRSTVRRKTSIINQSVGVATTDDIQQKKNYDSTPK